MIRVLPLVLSLSSAVSSTHLPVSEKTCVSMSTQTVIIRVGEYPNKPGKRIYLNADELYLANNVKIHKDDKGYYVSEYDINKKLSDKIYQNLKAQGVNVVLLTSKDKSEDLNRAGRKAMTYNPAIYFSVHHNSFEDDSEGYFLMTNQGNTREQKIAQSISDSLKNNPTNIPQLSNRIQDGYIGEMNETGGTLNILYEGGFFSNKNELYKITSNEHTDFVAKQIADELVKVLSNL